MTSPGVYSELQQEQMTAVTHSPHFSGHSFLDVLKNVFQHENFRGAWNQLRVIKIHSQLYQQVGEISLLLGTWVSNCRSNCGNYTFGGFAK